MSYEKELVDLMTQLIPAGFEKQRCVIYKGDGVVNIKFYLFSATTQWIREKMDKTLPRDLYKQRSMQALRFKDQVTVEDRLAPDYWNLCMIDVTSDGQHQASYSYDPEVDARYEQSIIDSIGQEQYDRYQAGTGAGASATSEQVDSAETYTIPELLGFIQTELLPDMPTDWQQLVLNAACFDEQGKQGVSLICHYKHGNDLKRFTPTNSIGPMNAVLKLQKLMSSDGQPWSTLELVFKPTGEVELTPQS